MKKVVLDQHQCTEARKISSQSKTKLGKKIVNQNVHQLKQAPLIFAVEVIDALNLCLQRNAVQHHQKRKMIKANSTILVYQEPPTHLCLTSDFRISQL